MKIMVRLGLLLMTPFMVMIYWRNNLKELDNLHANYDLNYAE